MRGEGDDINLWRLSETLTLVEASMLSEEINPAVFLLAEPSAPGRSRIVGPMQHEDDDPEELPNTRFRTIYFALCKAVEAKTLNTQRTDTHNDEILGSTVVAVDELKAWFAHRGFRPRFFFPEPAVQEFPNSGHPRYARKLAAAVAAWEAVEKAEPNFSVKQSLVRWLNKNATSFGLVDDDNAPQKKIIDDIAAVANWQIGGGAPKTTAVVKTNSKKNREAEVAEE